MIDYRNHPVIKAVMDIASGAHTKVGQTYNGKPYFDEHVMSVFEYGLKFLYLIPEPFRVAALSGILLHDVLEDCPTVYTYNDLLKKVTSALRGQEYGAYHDPEEYAKIILEIVFAVTNNTGRTRPERADDAYYEKIRNTAFAPYAKLCDRLANALASYNSGKGMSAVYIKEYSHFKEKVFIDILLAPLVHELDIMLLSDRDRGNIAWGSLVVNDITNLVYIVEKIEITTGADNDPFEVWVDCVGAYAENSSREERELVTFPLAELRKHW